MKKEKRKANKEKKLGALLNIMSSNKNDEFAKKTEISDSKPNGKSKGINRNGKHNDEESQSDEKLTILVRF